MSEIAERDFDAPDAPSYGAIAKFAKGKRLRFPDFTLEYIGETSVPGPGDANWVIRRKEFRVASPHGPQTIDWSYSTKHPVAGSPGTQIVDWSMGASDIGATLFECGEDRFLLELMFSVHDPGRQLNKDELIITKLERIEAGGIDDTSNCIVRGTFVGIELWDGAPSPVQKLKVSQWIRGQGPTELEVDVSKSRYWIGREAQYLLNYERGIGWVLLIAMNVTLDQAMEIAWEEMWKHGHAVSYHSHNVTVDPEENGSGDHWMIRFELKHPLPSGRSGEKHAVCVNRLTGDAQLMPSG